MWRTCGRADAMGGVTMTAEPSSAALTYTDHSRARREGITRGLFCAGPSDPGWGCCLPEADPRPCALSSEAPMNPLSSRRIAVAAAVSCALLLPIAAVHADESPSAAPSAAPISAESRAFTVGMTDDVDSLNPFTGIVATSYEMYQLNYATLTEYGADGLLARTRPRRAAGTSRPTDHLDLQDPPGPDVDRRAAAHGQGRRLHVQPDHERRVRADQLQHLHRRTSRRSRRPMTRRWS